MFDGGAFGDLFDFDGDGKLDDIELAADFMAWQSLIDDADDDDLSMSDSDEFDTHAFDSIDADFKPFG